MKFHRHLYLMIVVLISVLAGCTSNQLTIRTSPSKASVKIYAKSGMLHEGTSDIVDFKIDDTNKKQVYGDGTTARLGIAIEKVGYRPIFHFLTLTPAKKDPDLKKFSLEALDTNIQLDVDPPGAKAYFFNDKTEARKWSKDNMRKIPLGESFGGDGETNVNAYKEFAEFYSKYNSQIIYREDSNVTLPWNQSYTSATARSAFANVKAIRIEAEDYLPIIEDFSIEPGKNNTKLYQLKKMNTVLKVLSDIEGVEIEDTSSNFGYFGKTPLVRQFSYKECTRDENFWRDSKITMTLRAYKAGFIDQKIDVAIPWGEEITVKVSLKPRTNQITFQSDPEGVHVYVLRKKKETQYKKADDGKGKWEENEILVEKHLGTTPFTYSMDASDPLEHNDDLIYKKPGYMDGKGDKFAIGVNSYHKVMVPAVVKER